MNPHQLPSFRQQSSSSSHNLNQWVILFRLKYETHSIQMWSTKSPIYWCGCWNRTMRAHQRPPSWLNLTFNFILFVRCLIITILWLLYKGTLQHTWFMALVSTLSYNFHVELQKVFNRRCHKGKTYQIKLYSSSAQCSSCATISSFNWKRMW